MHSRPDTRPSDDVTGHATTEDPIHGRDRRMSVGGKLSFRRRARSIEAEDLPLRVGGDDPPELDELVPAGFDDVEIEVGPGKGAFLSAACEARPDTFLLGIEAAAGYAKLAAARLAKEGHDNALLLVDNAAQYLRDRVPARRLSRLHVYFPDPWPKRRHRGRRLFTDDAPPSLHRVLRPGGWLLFASDNAAYSGQTARVLGNSPLFERDEDEEARLLEAGPGHAFSPTHFERKYLAEGRIIRRYAFRAVAD